MKVEVVETSLVAPSEATPRHALWLSNLDLAVPKKHLPLVYYYPRPEQGEQEDASMVAARLRNALASALVPFYPLAGRLAVGAGGRVEIDCTGEGALFVVARADFTGDEMFADFVPSPEAHRLLVPSAASTGDPPCVLTMVQVTFLKCGGVVIGTGVHHVTMDGAGACQFIRTWTALARGAAPDAVAAPPPCHDRTLLRARSPPRVEFEHPVYHPSYLTGTHRPFVTRVYAVPPKLLADIKDRCAPGTSTYCAVAAHLWRAVCVARGLPADSDTQLRVPADVRQRLRPPLPASYLGNAIMRDMVTVKVEDMLSQPLGFVAEKIKSTVSSLNDPVVRSVIDFLELESEKMPPASVRFMPESDLWVVSWLGMPFYDADFGWGRPSLVSPAQIFGSGVAYITRRGGNKDDPVSVLLAIEPEYLECFEKVFYDE